MSASTYAMTPAGNALIRPTPSEPRAWRAARSGAPRTRRTDENTGARQHFFEVLVMLPNTAPSYPEPTEQRSRDPTSPAFGFKQSDYKTGRT